MYIDSSNEGFLYIKGLLLLKLIDAPEE